MAEPLLVTAGSVDTTPSRSVRLSGFEDRKAPYEGVADHLELNAVLLRQGKTAALMLAADALFIGSAVERMLRLKLEELGLPECLVLTGASHTHFAPNVDRRRTELGDDDDEYRGAFERSAVALVEHLVTTEPFVAGCSYAQGTAHHSVNRRRRAWVAARGLPRRVTAMRANRRGPRDESLHVLSLADRAGVVRAVVWSYACHPVAYPSPLSVTSEFPGVARARLREHFGHELPVLFLQGFSGDIRPTALISPGRNPLRWLSRLLNGAELGRFSSREWGVWTEALAAPVVELAASTEWLEPVLRHDTQRIDVAEFLPAERPGRSLTAILLELGPDLRFVALSAEVVAEYGEHVRRIFRGRTIPVGCTGDVYGYLPTARMLPEGGYEVDGFTKPFAVRGPFDPAVEERVAELLSSLTPRG